VSLHDAAVAGPERIVVIGASAGGVETLKQVLCDLPGDFPGAVCVVLHVPAYQRSLLPKILGECGQLQAVHPEDGDKLKAGRIYVAPPDHHLLVGDEQVIVSRGPKENRFRPSIDALFRSAAYCHESKAIGVVLSGALDDGTSGLWSIKRMAASRSFNSRMMRNSNRCRRARWNMWSRTTSRRRARSGHY
jgi:two-component system chemotaxis response regulator CheB